MIDPTLRKLVIAATVFSLGHHLDHMLRGNHVGWPVAAHVNAFTYSLGFYVVIVIGAYLSWKGKVGPGFWSVLTMVGAIFVATLHFSPIAVEPPKDILDIYSSSAMGWFAFAWLIVFVGVLVITSVYGAFLWFRRNSN